MCAEGARYLEMCLKECVKIKLTARCLDALQVRAQLRG